jgi:hypothetical protein
MWLKWLPWRYIIRSAARRHGFVDPLAVLARLSRFGEPSEVVVPMELLRAGATFHARGLMNASVIQHNLDWVWPFWVERQFNPQDEAFVPRAFSITHVNLTHRNWTAVGVPDVDLYPVVDPCGLLTPHWDGWSIDGWILPGDGAPLLPSRSSEVHQRLEPPSPQNGLTVVTEVEDGPVRLFSEADVITDGAEPICRQRWVATSRVAGWFAISLRPYNPEGVSFVYQIELGEDATAWTVDGVSRVWFSRPADRHLASDYRNGDVYQRAPDGDRQQSVGCPVGMATAAALYRLEPRSPLRLELRIPLTRQGLGGGTSKPAVVTTRPASSASIGGGPSAWHDALARQAKLDIPDRRHQFLYDAALRQLVLLTPGHVFPGPFTYKRFWVRDAAFILHALLCAGFLDRVERTLPQLLATQRGSGYFHSQEGEWDANGEALWTLFRFCKLTGQSPPDHWRRALVRGGRWIAKKRVKGTDAPHDGLLPAGFSAEHLGPNDYYYFDDFWSIAGLRGAAALLDVLDEKDVAEEFRHVADDLVAAVRRSLQVTAAERLRPGIPASPYRRMDAGAIGSLAGGYPLQLLEAEDRQLQDTAAFLREQCFVNGAFFQDMIHSGINVYLTLHVAQVLLRAGIPDWFEMVDAVARLASPTGQWPEAIHPRTKGGCMGDGQHMWAAAEWVMAMRNAFVREEQDRLILASGIPRRWLQSGKPMSFGPAPTPWGDVHVSVESTPQGINVQWKGQWRTDPPPVEIRLHGFQPIQEAGSGSAKLQQIDG